MTKHEGRLAPRHRKPESQSRKTIHTIIALMSMAVLIVLGLLYVVVAR